MRDHVYLDSSALVKLVVFEPESAALREFLKGRAPRLSSGLAEVECRARCDGPATAPSSSGAPARSWPASPSSTSTV